MADDLAALLAEHNTLMPGHLIDRETKTLSYQCVCKQVVSHPTTMSRPLSLAAHQAEVLGAAGWVKGREEWGVKYPEAVNTGYKSEVQAHLDATHWNGTVVHRYVTDWEEA